MTLLSVIHTTCNRLVVPASFPAAIFAFGEADHLIQRSVPCMGNGMSASDKQPVSVLDRHTMRP